MVHTSSAMILSFARGRARRVARELIELEFRLDVDAITAYGALALLRTEREGLLREVDAHVRDLAALALELDPADALRSAIDRACACYVARRDGRFDREIAWVRSLRILEGAITARRR
jgi:hypothetical protein